MPCLPEQLTRKRLLRKILVINLYSFFISAMSDTTITFLDRLHNRTTKGIEEEIGKRVTFSNGIISQLIQFIDKRITRGKDIGKMLEEWPGFGAKKPKAEKDEKTANADEKMEIKVEGKSEEERKEEKESLKKEADEG